MQTFCSRPELYELISITGIKIAKLKTSEVSNFLGQISKFAPLAYIIDPHVKKSRQKLNLHLIDFLVVYILLLKKSISLQTVLTDACPLQREVEYS